MTVRDPNNVGAGMVCDSLGRNTQRTDTFGDVTKTDSIANRAYNARGGLSELKLDVPVPKLAVLHCGRTSKAVSGRSVPVGNFLS